ncbi:VPLPA-CTERM sorting domain-containing protein [uncultured Roseobacter sp.]|uniref:VPLPA-CTERM sorting domain-containing protein n=1 Tax=uncultured Roseobacter sp. TaxID=114847 RepID=UPI00263564DC|nr:VPLPA-CTERM sorting domain-containing protein [uncultured Roseobacter sp.]
MKIMTIAAVLTALSVSAVSAATTKIDFTDPATKGWTWGADFLSEDEQVSADVTAHRYDSDTKTVGSRIWLGQWKGYGLGACSSAGRHGCTDDHRADGYIYNDLIKLSFGEDVTLREIEFGSFSSKTIRTGEVIGTERVCRWRWGRLRCSTRSVYGTETLYDDFDLFAGEPLEFLFVSDVAGSVDLGADAARASVFGIGAPQWDDSFKIRSVTVEYGSVPLPATGLMLLAAVGGLAARKTRRKA